ncbi:class I SAM-dependent methyltransferase [Halocatena marina]|uniref:class I SAM-dependent methyltransferase n=1 Tax=Halocatena marina TaxID=2934937 RepID=UPI00200D5FA7|nr:class I SAM-dependent methyltransferase [Halocatena marina]
MSSDEESPISQAVYDQLATSYDDITTSAVREQYEWPAVQSLLPSLDGIHVLDAACGNGFYTERIVECGATAVGVDASPEMLSHAQERFADDDRVEVNQADLTDGLPCLEDDAFDLVLCQLALEHIEAWEAVFAGFNRILMPGGQVVVSTSHPVRDYIEAEYPVREQILAEEASYPEIEQVDRDWGDEDSECVVPFYRRPLAGMFDPALNNGFVVEQVVEPVVTDAFSEATPKFATVLRDGPPLFICVRYLKPR